MDKSQPWGKLDRARGRSHYLAHHCADVAACFLGLATSRVIRARLERAAGRALSPTDIERLGVLVFLHDAGKLHPGFQAKGWPDGTWNGPKAGHIQEGLDIFIALGDGPAARALHLGHLCAWGVDESLLRTVLAHHGRPLKRDNGDRAGLARHSWRCVGPYDPDAAAARMGALLPHWFPAAFETTGEPLPCSPAFEHLLAGLTALADWIGSDATRFTFVPELDPSYMACARCIAAKALAAFGLENARQRAMRMAPATFTEVSGRAAPNAQQRLIGDTDLDARLVILEAETGSGKTEAALWRYAQLFAAGRVDGLYFAVPTRAAAAQLHRRVCEASRRLFADADPQPVLAVPGYLRAGSSEGTPLPGWQVRWDDEAVADEAMLAARWPAEDAKRYLAAQIAVGTVDQAMLGALKVKHAYTRAAGLARSLLVIDEVHASDRFMTAIQKRLLEAHLSIGGYAMLMSATLGSSARAEWLDQKQPAFEEAVAARYPAVWTSNDGTPRTPDEPPARSKAVAMETLPTMAQAATAARALEAARAGARVLVIRNTVERAIETLEALEGLIGPGDGDLLFEVDGVKTLHHGRFAPGDRKRLDAAVEAALDTKPMRAAGGKIVVGTQTLEQSLDIDADVLLTDLCPVDVLLQRIGRVHRHVLQRSRGFETPRCVVMLPERGLAALLKPDFENGLGAWRRQDGTYEGIYRDLAILELTRRLIERHEVWTIPAMNRSFVEGATHPAAVEALLAELGATWRSYYQEVIAQELAQGTIAAHYAIDRSKRFEDLEFPDEERIRTRLGEEGLRLLFAQPLPRSPFGADVDQIVLPAYWSRGVPVDEPPRVLSSTGRSISFAAGEARFTYDRHGVRRVRQAHESPDGPSRSV